MTTFDKREEGFENRFAHDEAMRFRAQARRNKLLGLWVAEQLGKSGTDADAYAQGLMMADLAEPGEEDVFKTIRHDIDAAGIDLSDHRIRRRMEELMAEAVEAVKAGR